MGGGIERGEKNSLGELVRLGQTQTLILTLRTLVKTAHWDGDGGGWNIKYSNKRGRIKTHVEVHPEQLPIGH